MYILHLMLLHNVYFVFLRFAKFRKLKRHPEYHQVFYIRKFNLTVMRIEFSCGTVDEIDGLLQKMLFLSFRESMIVSEFFASNVINLRVFTFTNIYGYIFSDIDYI